MLRGQGKKAILEAWFPTSGDQPGVGWLSLHSSYSATGGNELVGGAYSRVATRWFGISDEPFATRKVCQPFPSTPFMIPAGATVAWIGLWTEFEGGVLLGMFPSGGIWGGGYIGNNAWNTEQGYDGNPLVPFMTDGGTSWMRAARHPYWEQQFVPEIGDYVPVPGNGWQVVYWSVSRYENTMPEMTPGETILTLTNVSRNGFELIAAGESSPRTWNSMGQGFLQLIQPLHFVDPGDFVFLELTIAIHGVYDGEQFI
jgi:hypothetical protein